MLFSNSTLFLPSNSFLPILLFLILFIFFPTLECRRRGAAGRLRCRLGSGGAATTPGTALGPGGCHPRGRPGLSRAPARKPQSPKSYWEVLFVFFYLYPVAWGPKGHGSGKAAAPSGQRRSFIHFKNLFPDPDQLARSWWGAPHLLPCVP